jgi:hypothetical protein
MVNLNPRKTRDPVGSNTASTAAVLAILLFTAPAFAQLRDSFEGPQPSWLLQDADCGVKLLGKQRDYRHSHSGQASEHIRLAVGNGTYVHLVRPIGMAPVIAEFRPSLYLKADRASLQFMARVVFPRSIDPGTRQPVTALLRGDLYTDVGEWQELAVRDAARLVEREAVQKRTTFGRHFDPGEAYVDLLVINAYGAPGNVELWIDDLEIQGYINLQSDDQGAAPGVAGQPLSAGPPAAEVQGSLLLVGGRPFAPRIIQHQGEPLEWLKSLGFNTVKLSASPSIDQLQEARRLGLWLVAPPPYGDESIPREALAPVLAWSLGSRLGQRDLAGTEALAEEIRRFEPEQHRPLVAGVDSALAEMSRIAPLVILDRNTVATSQELASLRHWLLARPRLARPGTPFWATIATERPAKLTEQLVLLSQGQAIEDDVDPEQLRLAAYCALAAGARGLVFPSQSPLAIDSGSGALRTDAIKLLNLELRLLEPWISTGTFAEELAAADGSVQASMLATERSRLLLVTQHAPAQQFVLGPPPRSSLQVTVPGVSISDQAYRVSLAGIKQLKISHTSGGAHLTLDDAGLATAVVITQDPLAMHHLRRTLADARAEAARLRHDLAVRRLGRVAEIDGSLRATQTALVARTEPLTGPLRDAQANLDQATRLMSSGDYEALHAALHRTETALAKIRRGHWEQTAAAFPSPAASPCLAQFTALPLHWQLAQRMQQGRFGGNEQVAGDLESLEQMIEAGWKQERRPITGVKCDVSLSLQNPHSGRSALRMQAWVDDPQSAPSVVEQPLIWITSSPVPVRQGQIVRVHAWIHVPRPIAGSSDGLLIFDSAGGPDLGDRVRLTQGWRELTLYRAAGQNGELTVTFALTGIGEAWVDDLSVSLLDPEPVRSP